MTPLQERAITFLHGKGTATPDAIGAELGLDKSAVGHLLYDLGASGMGYVTAATRHGYMCLTLNGLRVAPALIRGEKPTVQSPKITAAPPAPKPVMSSVKGASGRGTCTKEASNGRIARESVRPSGENGGAQRHDASRVSANEEEKKTAALTSEDASRPPSAPSPDREAGVDQGARPDAGTSPLRAGPPSSANREAAPSSPATTYAPRPESQPVRQAEVSGGGADAVAKPLKCLATHPEHRTGCERMQGHGGTIHVDRLRRQWPVASSKTSESGPHENPDASGLRKRTENLGPSEQSSGEPTPLSAVQQGGAEVACRAHNPKVAGSNPAPATSSSSRVDVVENDDGRVVLKGDHAPVVGPDRSTHEPERIAHLGAIPELLKLAAQREATGRLLLDDAAAIRRTISILADDGAIPPVT